MTMHLEGPWLSTTGKKRGPKKWASSDEKRRAEQRKSDWELKLKEFDKMKPKFSNTKPVPKRKSDWSLGVPKAPPGRETAKIASQDTGWVACTKVADTVYTGTKIKGIGTMHKSNAVPVFSNEEAVDISTMRR